jgi:hypothetical protein
LTTTVVQEQKKYFTTLLAPLVIFYLLRTVPGMVSVVPEPGLSASHKCFPVPQAQNYCGLKLIVKNVITVSVTKAFNSFYNYVKFLFNFVLDAVADMPAKKG